MITAITAEMTDELSDYERERGKPMPGRNHAIVQSQLIMSFGAQVGDRYRVASELTLEFPDGSRLTPDICALERRPLDCYHEQIRYRQAPLMVIEIPSATQGFQSILDKFDVYFANGVKSAWVVQIGMKAIAIYQPSSPLPLICQQGEIIDPVTGLKAHLEEIFA